MASDSDMLVGRRIIEAISWKLASEFHRRHPDRMSIIETHPGGGQYDCLSFFCEKEVIAHLNRVGSFTPNASEHVISWENLWPRCMSNEGLREVLDEMSEACRLEIPKKLPPTQPASLSYRVMAQISAALCLDLSEWEWRAGDEDTSGWPAPDSRDHWFGLLSMEEELRCAKAMEQNGSLGRLGYWFLLQDDEPRCCISDDARYWSNSSPSVDLMANYKKNRSVYGLAGTVLANL